MKNLLWACIIAGYSACFVFVGAVAYNAFHY